MKETEEQAKGSEQKQYPPGHTLTERERQDEYHNLLNGVAQIFKRDPDIHQAILGTYFNNKRTISLNLISVARLDSLDIKPKTARYTLSVSRYEITEELILTKTEGTLREELKLAREEMKHLIQYRYFNTEFEFSGEDKNAIEANNNNLAVNKARELLAKTQIDLGKIQPANSSSDV